MTPSAVRAVIFDCDGVLVDSEPTHAKATSEHLASLGTPIAPELFDRLIGMRVRDQMDVVAKLTGHDADALFTGREARFWKLIHAEFPAMPDAAETIRRLHAGGFVIGVATSGTREYIDHVVSQLHISHLVAAVTCGDDVRQPKPDPECYLRTASAMGVPASRCAAVEDSELGAASAAAARMQVLRLNRDGGAVWASTRRDFSSLASIGDYLLATPVATRAESALIGGGDPPR
ncbi:MAG: HAD family hydrolase [Acidothermaceae bacterium]